MTKSDSVAGPRAGMAVNIESPHRSDRLLEVNNLGKSYADGQRVTTAIQSIDFTVSSGSFISIVGPSGCGKTTLIKCISGLLPPTQGHVRLHGTLVTKPPANMALVFQDYSRSLYPWYSVRKNVELPIRKLAKAERADIVMESLKAVGLSDYADYHPWQLSGGMQQRVAIARALAYRPEILIMDEPFASVDAQTRSELEDLVLSLRERYQITMLLVTHDIDEAVYMSDQIVTLTRSPSSVSSLIDVQLPWPRDQLATKELPAFARHRSEVYRRIVGR